MRLRHVPRKKGERERAKNHLIKESWQRKGKEGDELVSLILTKAGGAAHPECRIHIIGWSKKRKGRFVSSL